MRSWRGSVRTLAEHPVQVWRFEGGVPVETWLYSRRQSALDEFWS